MERQGAFQRQETFLDVIRWLSEMTLEYYLVQRIVISVASGIGFPVSILFSVIGATACAFALHQLTGWLERCLFLRRG